MGILDNAAGDENSLLESLESPLMAVARFSSASQIVPGFGSARRGRIFVWRKPQFEMLDGTAMLRIVRIESVYPEEANE
jgi:hypothetical protein